MATVDKTTNMILRKENFGAINLKYMESSEQAEGAAPCPFCKGIPVKYSGTESVKYLRCYCGIWDSGITSRGEDDNIIYSKLVKEWNRRVGA